MSRTRPHEGWFRLAGVTGTGNVAAPVLGGRRGVFGGLVLISQVQGPGAAFTFGDVHVFQAAPSGFGQDQGEGEAEHGHSGGQ
jgi:hypothetical protein